MAKSHATAPRKLAGSSSPSAYSDNTADRLQAYLDSVEPRDAAGDFKGYRNGILQILRLAASAQGEDPLTLRLTDDQCADVLHFIAYSDPIRPKDWWTEPKDAPSHIVGFIFVLHALEDSLRATKVQS